MRSRAAYFLPVLEYLGALFWVFGFVMLAPLVVLAVYRGQGREEVSLFCFAVPAVASLALGLVLNRRLVLRPLDTRRSMLLCGLAWIVISAVAAVPLCMGIDASYLDAYFESVSGFTTTGITMFEGLDKMPRSILFWRSLMQWLGGLGILTFFLALVTGSGSAHALYTAESHKIAAKRPAPGLWNTLRILWAIYTGLTVLTMLLLVLEGMSLYDAINHAFTALSTGGYSPHDASIDFYRTQEFAHYRAIEYTLTFAMLLGGTNFFIHYRVLTGEVRALWDNFEMRLWWAILFGCIGLVMADRFMAHGVGDVEDTFRYAAFQVVAIATTTGFGTKDIMGDYFPALSKQIFLVLMVIGGCVGSTGGGFKVLRIGILWKMMVRQIRRIMYGRSAVIPVLADGEVIEVEEIRRIAGLFFAWICLLAFGAGVTAFLSPHDATASASGMFSALGNIGPCYMSVREVSRLDPVVKMVYILGMLAGRLEILPILLLFSPRTWR